MTEVEPGVSGGRPRIMWFRRDLRLGDLPALVRAAEGAGGVVGLFVADPMLLSQSARSRRLAAAVEALDRSMAGALLVRAGDPASVVGEVAAEVGATEVHISADCAPYGRRRDADVAAALDRGGRRLVATGSSYAISPGRVTKADGTPYRVFTPFYRAWRDHGWPPPPGSPVGPDRPIGSPPDVPEVGWIRLPGLGSAGLLRHVAHLDCPEPTTGPEGVGEAAALRRWADFCSGDLADYATLRDRADLAGTSRLSAHLRFGEIHPRTLLRDLSRFGDAPGAEAFRREIAFREFYADVLWHHPRSATSSLDRRFDDHMVYRNGPTADADFEAWCEGRTGFPFVDAGMRQLLADGWMHNRVRMVVASFLVKDLHLPWWRGARWFMSRLRDGDLASNAAGWQWTAGCGTDAAPFHRIFNPVSQGKRFDPDGDYVRRYVPELRGLPGSAAHEPWLHPLLAPDYPPRIVDHAAERLAALDRHRQMRTAAEDS